MPVLLFHPHGVTENMYQPCDKCLLFIQYFLSNLDSNKEELIDIQLKLTKIVCPNQTSKQIEP